MFDIETPTYFDACPRVVVIGDVHGDLSRLMEVLYTTKILDNNGRWIAEPSNTIVIQLGDQVDGRARGGEEGWDKIPDTEVMTFMDRLDTMARLGGGRAISLIGNHEMMNVIGDFTYVSDKYRTPLRESQFRPGGRFAQLLAKRCVVVKIGSLLFAHAGVLPHHLAAVDNDLHIFNKLVRKMLRGEMMDVYEAEIFNSCVLGNEGMLWTRVYMESLNKPEMLHEILTYVLGETKTKLMCIGHNTVATITGVGGGRLWFVDAGLSRSYGNDTFQVLEILNDGEEFRLNEIRTDKK